MDIIKELKGLMEKRLRTNISHTEFYIRLNMIIDDYEIKNRNYILIDNRRKGERRKFQLWGDRYAKLRAQERAASEASERFSRCVDARGAYTFNTRNVPRGSMLATFHGNYYMREDGIWHKEERKEERRIKESDYILVQPSPGVRMDKAYARKKPSGALFGVWACDERKSDRRKT